MIQQLTKAIVTAAIVLVTSTSFADTNPYHNFNNPYDVNDNNKVTPHDFLLIVNQIHRQSSSELVASIVAMDTYYWDTSNDMRVTPHDALLVANHITATTPEPATCVTAAMGLIVLGGYCWRRRRKRG